MDINNFIFEFDKLRDENRAKQMKYYMRGKFEFLGIGAVDRKNIENILFKNEDKTYIDFKFVDDCYDNEYRELQLVALNYLKLKKKYLKYDDIDKLKRYILTKSWWDSIDVLDKIVGDIALRDSRVNDILLEWSLDDNIWLRRVAIDHQILRKNKTNTELLEKIIVNNLYQKEFFINKAIGWSLRDYSKTNKKWVSDFIEKYKNAGLSNLSIREASKYL